MHEIALQHVMSLRTYGVKVRDASLDAIAAVYKSTPCLSLVNFEPPWAACEQTSEQNHDIRVSNRHHYALSRENPSKFWTWDGTISILWERFLYLSAHARLHTSHSWHNLSLRPTSSSSYHALPNSEFTNQKEQFTKSSHLELHILRLAHHSPHRDDATPNPSSSYGHRPAALNVILGSDNRLALHKGFPVKAG